MDISSAPTTAHYRLVAVLWTLGIIGVCLMPASTLASVEPQLGADKVVHIFLFAVFGSLWMRALFPPGLDVSANQFRQRALGVILVGAGLAAGTEALQQALPVRRVADPYDLAADLVGLVLAVVGYSFFVQRPQTSVSGREAD